MHCVSFIGLFVCCMYPIYCCNVFLCSIFPEKHILILITVENVCMTVKESCIYVDRLCLLYCTTAVPEHLPVSCAVSFTVVDNSSILSFCPSGLTICWIHTVTLHLWWQITPAACVRRHLWLTLMQIQNDKLTHFFWESSQNHTKVSG